MGAACSLHQAEVVDFLEQLYGEDLHAKRVLSLASATLGVLRSGSLAVHAIGQGLAHAQGTLPKHGVKQVDRLLSNDGIVMENFFARWVAQAVGSREQVVVALDWTSFDADRQSTLVIALLTDHGRATPLMWQTVWNETLKGRQTDYEDALLLRLLAALPEAVKVTVVADRGFADCKLLRHLKEELGFDYVIRLRGQYYLSDAKGERRKAAKWAQKGGRARLLRNATLTDLHGYVVATAVCVHDKEMKEPWCLVSSLSEVSARTLIGFYAKRWGIETSFRDIKDLRFGMGMTAVRISRPERRDRLLLLSALALSLLTLLGAAGEQLGFDQMLKANTVRRRTHALWRQGWMHYEAIPNMPESRLRPLLQTFTELLREQRAFTGLFGHI